MIDFVSWVGIWAEPTPGAHWLVSGTLTNPRCWLYYCWEGPVGNLLWPTSSVLLCTEPLPSFIFKNILEATSYFLFKIQLWERGSKKAWKGLEFSRIQHGLGSMKLSATRKPVPWSDMLIDILRFNFWLLNSEKH